MRTKIDILCLRLGVDLVRIHADLLLDGLRIV